MAGNTAIREFNEQERTQFRRPASDQNFYAETAKAAGGSYGPSGGSFAAKLQSQIGKAGGGSNILSVANEYLGVPYKMGGGRNPGALQNTDCSAFVSRVYSDATNGQVKLTPYTDAMYDETVPISPADARPGDLVFYQANDPDQPGTRFPHVAIYAGNNRVVDASTVLGHVGYHSIDIGARYKPEFRRPKALA